MEEVLRDDGRVVVAGKWVNCNTQDMANPTVRVKLVAQEVNTGNTSEDVYAATRPLGAKRVLFSRWAKEGKGMASDYNYTSSM